MYPSNTGIPTATAGGTHGQDVDLSGQGEVGYGSWHAGISVDYYMAAVLLGALALLWLLAYLFKGARI